MSYNAHYKRPAFVEYEAFVLINIWARTLAPTNWMKLHIRTDVRALVCGRVLLQTKYLRTYLPTHTHTFKCFVSFVNRVSSRVCLLVHSSPFYAGKNALSHACNIRWLLLFASRSRSHIQHTGFLSPCRNVCRYIFDDKVYMWPENNQNTVRYVVVANAGYIVVCTPRTAAASWKPLKTSHCTITTKKHANTKAMANAPVRIKYWCGHPNTMTELSTHNFFIHTQTPNKIKQIIGLYPFIEKASKTRVIECAEHTLNFSYFIKKYYFISTKNSASRFSHASFELNFWPSFFCIA